MFLHLIAGVGGENRFRWLNGENTIQNVFGTHITLWNDSLKWLGTACCVQWPRELTRGSFGATVIDMTLWYCGEKPASQFPSRHPVPSEAETSQKVTVTESSCFFPPSGHFQLINMFLNFVIYSDLSSTDRRGYHSPSPQNNKIWGGVTSGADTVLRWVLTVFWVNG